MFEHFNFSKAQIEKYYKSAKKDFEIARSADVSEVSFRFSYDAILKLAIAVCAENGLRIKAKKGHHVELIKKLSFYLNDPEIEVLAGEMRAKRNWNLYGGGVLISEKEAKSYLDWTKKIFQKTGDYFEKRQPRLKL